MHRDFPMPPALIAGAKRWLDGERGTPVQPRASATVMLLRDAEPGLEVFMLRRAGTMPFAPGMLAFPGGGVDPRDTDHEVPWAGPEPQAWARMLGQPAGQAQALVIAAVREVFEEAGVLLAGPDADHVIGAVDGQQWEQERAGLVAKERSFSDFLVRHQLVLRSDLVRARARWTTPECEPRRYDTWFFAAALPEGQDADGHTSEATTAAWRPPAAALADREAGREVLLPPTVVMTEQLHRHTDVASVLAEPVSLRQVQPWPVEHDDAMWMRAPVDADGNGLPPADDDEGMP